MHERGYGKIMEVVCDGYCKFPCVCQEEELLEHCANCEVEKMLGALNE